MSPAVTKRDRGDHLFVVLTLLPNNYAYLLV